MNSRSTSDLHLCCRHHPSNTDRLLTQFFASVLSWSLVHDFGGHACLSCAYFDVHYTYIDTQPVPLENCSKSDTLGADVADFIFNSADHGIGSPGEWLQKCAILYMYEH